MQVSKRDTGIGLEAGPEVQRTVLFGIVGDSFNIEQDQLFF